MAFSYIGQVAANQNKTSGTTITANPTGTIPVGSLLIVECVSDNTGTANQNSGSTEHSFTDNAGNTYTKVREVLRGAGAAAGGVTTSIWWCVTTAQLTTSSVLTLTLSAARTAKAFRVHQFSKEGTVTVQSDNGANGASTTPSVALSGMPSGEYLLFGTAGYEGPTTATFTKDADYTNPSTLVYGTSGGTANTNVCVVSGYRIATLTGDTYNPTWGTSSDWGAILVAFKDTVSPPSSAPGNFQATAYDSYIALSWDAVSGASWYEVAAGTSASPTNWFSVGNVTSFQLGGLVNGTGYYVRVRAANSGGAGPATSDLYRTPTSDSGYVQLDADAGWRFPNTVLTANPTAYSRTWTGGASYYTRAPRGIYNTNGTLNQDAFLNLPSRPSRIRAQVREGSSVDSAVFVRFRAVTASWTSSFAVMWYADANGSMELIIAQDGSSTTVASGAYSRSPLASYLLEVLDNGSSITVKVNGTTVLTHNSTLYNQASYAGIATSSSTPSFGWVSWDAPYTGNPVDLSLPMSASASPTLPLRRARRVSMSTTASVTVTEALRRSRKMALGVSGTVTVAEALKRARKMALAVPVVSSPSLALKRVRWMALGVSGASTSSLGLSRGKPIALAVSALATQAATLRRVRPVALGVSGTVTVAGALGRVRQIALEVSGASTLTPALSRTLSVTLSMSGAVTAIYPLVRARGMALPATGNATMDAALSRRFDFEGGWAGSSALALGIARTRGLAALTWSGAVLSGVMGRARGMGATLGATSTVEAALGRGRPVALTATATALPALALGRGRGLSAAFAGTVEATYALEVSEGGEVIELTLTATAIALPALALGRGRGLGAALEAATAASATLWRARGLDLETSMRASMSATLGRTFHYSLEAIAATTWVGELGRARGLGLPIQGLNVQTLTLGRGRGLVAPFQAGVVAAFPLRRALGLALGALESTALTLTPQVLRGMGAAFAASASMTLALGEVSYKGYVGVSSVLMGRVALTTSATAYAPTGVWAVTVSHRVVPTGRVILGDSPVAIIEIGEV